MNTAFPPPLPGKAGKSPAAAFVDVLAKISLVMGVLSVAYALCQGLVLMLVPDGFTQGLFEQGSEFLPPLPGTLRWLLDHLALLTWIMLLSSLAFLVIAYGMLRRHNAARIAFIVFLVIGTLGNFASIILMLEVLHWMEGIGANLPADSGMQEQIRASNLWSMAMGIVSAIAFAALHGWIVWKLCTAQVRNQFNRQA